MEKKLFQKDIVLFFLITLLFFVSISAFDPFISPYAKELGISPSAIGGIVGVAGLASLFTRLPVGILSDVFLKRKLFLQVGLLVTIIPWTLAFLTPNATTLYLGKISDGLTGSTWVVYNVMFASYFGKKEAGKAVAILAAASPTGSLLGSTIGGIAANVYGYNFSFLVAVIAASVAFLLTLFLKEQKLDVGQPKYRPSVLVEQLSDKNLWIISILTIVCEMAVFGMRDTFVPLVAVDLGANPIIISWLSNTHKILDGIIAAFCAVYLFQKWGYVRTAVIGGLLHGFAAICIPFATNLPMLFGLQAVAGIAFSLSFTALFSLSIMNVAEHKQSTRMGFYQSMYSFGIFVGPVLMGILAERFSRDVSFFFIAILSVVAAIVTRLLLKSDTPEEQIVQEDISYYT
ncbi:MFS transporter [Priestia megaterium]|uniref:MFS transporter n=1 Tax=Priestia megaterium TaxID=1404 RepID=UPI00366F7A51